MYHWTGVRAGLESHDDHIVTMNGEYVYSNADIYEKAAAVPEGTNIIYSVIRTGETPEIRQVEVATMRFWIDDFMYCFGSGFIFGIIMISLGAVTYLNVKEGAASLSFLILCLVIGMYGVTGFEIQSSSYLMPLSIFCSSLMPAVALLFALHWPSTRELVQKHKWINGAVLLPSAVLFLLVLRAQLALSGTNFALDANAVATERQIDFLISLNNAYLSISAAFLFITIVVLCFRSKDAAIRGQARIVLLAIVGLLVAALLMLLISVRGINVPENYLSFIALIFPVSVAYSMSKYRMFGTAVLLRKSLSEERYRLLVEQSLTGICILQDDVIQFANNRLAQMSGYSVEELIGMPALDLVHPDDKEMVREVMMRQITGEGTTGYLEFRGITKGGKAKWIEALGPAIIFEGKPAIFINIIDATERKRIEQELNKHREELEELVATRTESLRESREQLRALSAHLQSLREQERTHIAREIHDELGQALTVLKMDAFWLAQNVPNNEKALLDKTTAMLKLVDNTVQSVKKISTELRPGLLDDLGLASAIEWQAEEFQKHTGIECNPSIFIEDIGLDKEYSTAVFRIFQETVTNVIRHAEATKLTVKLEERNGEIILTVTDNGKGIGKEDISKAGAFGLMGIRERAHALGGKMEIEGIPGKGTTLTVTIPIDR
jgi:PAS domain S-box-containing protein